MTSQFVRRSFRYVLWSGIALIISVTALTYSHWSPVLTTWVQTIISGRRSSIASDSHSHGSDAHDDHGHDHAGHNDSTSLHLSDQARQNLGLTGDGTAEVKLSDFQRSIRIPAVIVEHTGQTRFQVATPMTGIVLDIHVTEGEAVGADRLLFEIRLTHEDLVRSQTEFVQALGELDIENREIARLKVAAESGGVARKTLLEREYSRDKLEALLVVQREALRLHGLSEKQVQQIADTRRLLQELKVYSPASDGTTPRELKLSRTDTDNEFRAVSVSSVVEAPLVLRELNVQHGQAVDAGEPLATLVNYSELCIQGQAFEQDMDLLTKAAENNEKLTARFHASPSQPSATLELDIAYLEPELDPATRTFRFFLHLPNRIVRDKTSPQGRRFIDWQYRPGQRLQVEIPVERWTDQIVLPADAVAREGAESFVFQENGDHFDRVPVHVKYRDQSSVVIANDGQLFPGDVVATRSAHQMQIALENQTGGGVDPHAGHSH